MNDDLRIDHLVVAVRDLKMAIVDYQAHGFNVVHGGRHEHAPTQNALIVFADGSYIELIEWTAPAPNDRWYRVLSADGEGLVDFALRSADLPMLLMRVKGLGIAVEGPIAGSRVTPDGKQLRWQVGRPAFSELPFFCADITPRTLRVPEGDVRTHDNGAIGIGTVTVAVHDAAASLKDYRRLLCLASDSVCNLVTYSIKSLGVSVGIVTMRDSEIVLVSCQRAATTPAANRIRDVLKKRGPGAYAVTLRVLDAHDVITIGPNPEIGVSIEFSHHPVSLAGKIYLTK